MKWIQRDRQFELSSGRRVYANHGLVSIARHDEGFEIGEGYDGHIYPEGSRDWSAEPEVVWVDPPWTPEERAELADYMIALWQAFKAEEPK